MSHPFEKYEGININGKWIEKSVLLNTQWDLSNNAESAKAFAASLLNTKGSITVQTSGSTGSPKKLSFSKSAVYQSAKATNDFFDLKENASGLLTLPMQYIAGKMMVARALAGGYNLKVREPNGYPIEAGMKVSLMPITPFQLANQIDDLPLNEINTFLIGGGTVSPELQSKIHLSGINAFASFGMTETLSHFALAQIKKDTPLEYHCLNGVSIKTIDEGRLCINWPGITTTWLETNDLVEINHNRFKWLGRLDYLINSGGIKIIPEQIEELLYPHIQGDFFIFGIPHKTLGQELVLFVEMSNENVLDYEVEFPSTYHKPKRTIQVSSFERTTSGKIKRKSTVENWLNNQG